MALTRSTLIEDLEDASKIPSKRRPSGTKTVIEALTSSLYDTGVLPDELIRLINLIVKPNHLDQATKAAVIRHLYPASKVPNQALLQVIGCLGHGELKPPLASQALLVRWLVMVYGVLEDPQIISKAYPVLFNLLDTAALRSQLCHLLALVTRRKHVRPFRIQALLALARQCGAEPPLHGLLRVYKDYYPEIVVGDFVRGRASAFKHPDAQWRARLDDIRDSHLSRTQTDRASLRNGFQVDRLRSYRSRGQSGGGIPHVRTLHAQENSITLEEIDNAAAFVSNLDKLELPSQLVAVLADPLLQKLATLRSSHETNTRIHDWLSSCVADVKHGDADIDLLLDIVEVLHQYVSSIQTLPSELYPLFRELFELWDGKDRGDIISDVLSYIAIADFFELYQNILQPFEHSVLDGTATSQCFLLAFYISLLQRWKVELEASEDLSRLNVTSVTEVLNHATKLAVTLTQTCPTTATHLLILEFLEMAANFMNTSDLIHVLHVTIPPPALIYILLFTHSVAALSRLCNAVTTYKRGLEMFMTPPAVRPLTRPENEDVKTFNGFLMDICNCIWRSRAFTTGDANAHGCRIPSAAISALETYLETNDADTPLASAFSLSYAPALCMQSLVFVRDLENIELAETDGRLRQRHGGPVTQKSLTLLRSTGGLDMSWQEYRVGVLKHLAQKDLDGVANLMFNTMKIFMQAKSS